MSVDSNKHSNLHQDPNVAAQQLYRGLVASRVVSVLALLATIFLAWVLFTQFNHFALPQLQAIRLTIIFVGIVALAAVLVGSRLSLKKDQLTHEQRLRTISEQERANVRFRTAMEFSVVPKVLTDKDGVITFVNPAFAATASRPAATLVGTRLEDWMTTLEQAPQGITPPIEIGSSVQVDFCSLIRPLDQSVRTLRRYRISIPHSNGEMFSDIIQFDDLTQAIEDYRILADDRRVLEERVQQRTRALELVNQELESFAYSVSHDLRGPLRAIDGFGQVLRHTARPKLDEREVEYLDRITGATARMGELIDSLLRMSRLSTAPLDLQDINVSNLLEDVVIDVRSQFPDRGNVVVEIQPDIHVRADRVLLRNALTNLLSNSFKFTREVPAPRIQVLATPRNKYWMELRVSDNGVGFDQKYVSKLFRPFQRLHRSDEFEGHGIGLASVKRVVDRHGGTIEAIGEQGKGATILMTLPMAIPGADVLDPADA